MPFGGGTGEKMCAFFPFVAPYFVLWQSICVEGLIWKFCGCMTGRIKDLHFGK
jgi:hypothetical protein